MKDPTGYWNRLGVKYSPEQPRDAQGRWTDGGGAPVDQSPHNEVINTAKVGNFNIKRTHGESAKLLASYYKMAAPDLQKAFSGAYNHNVELEVREGSKRSGKYQSDVTVIARWKDDKGHVVAQQHTTFSDYGGIKWFSPQEINIGHREGNDNKGYWVRVAKKIQETISRRQDYWVNPVGPHVQTEGVR